ncbi:MAG TPA: YafY family protein [Ideonella sp.]|uniref:helix-turn-helix transcriptional regulator n=1 Tax=Ideonella sp. TaxID=1929293 RepID=UPI002E3182A0|nr:YafY family protein [Ideonella sp.]HEX5685836.1 YafY family protein [Ideonella sp.]
MLTSSSRLLRLLSLLQTRGHWAGAELAERLEIHPRTLRRDIDRLRELGYPIEASSGVAGGYAFKPGQALPPLLLDDDEALAVAIALRTAASGMVGGIEETALRAVVKLEQVMPARLRKRADALRTAIVPLDSIGPVIDAAQLAALAGACRDQLRARFAYTDIRGSASERTVEPQGVVHTGSRWYLVAWDRARDDWRTFRIDRIAAPVEIGGHFAPRPGPDGGDLKAFVSRSLAVSPYPERARIVLHAPRDAMARRIPAAYGLLETIDADRCLLQCGAHALDQLVYWLLALDVDFEVLEPAALQQRLIAAGERVARSVGAGVVTPPPPPSRR